MDKVTWTPDNIQRLHDIFGSMPVEDLAATFGTTVSAVRTAISRYGVNPENYGNHNKITRKLVSCLSCGNNFRSEGKHNRMCCRCKRTLT